MTSPTLILSLLITTYASVNKSQIAIFIHDSSFNSRSHFMLLEPLTPVLVPFLTMCKCVMSHSWTGLPSFREELHSSCKARSSAQISSQSADLVLSSLHFNSYRCMETECICDSSLCYPLQEKRRKKRFPNSSSLRVQHFSACPSWFMFYYPGHAYKKKFLGPLQKS